MYCLLYYNFNNETNNSIAIYIINVYIKRKGKLTRVSGMFGRSERNIDVRLRTTVSYT